MGRTPCCSAEGVKKGAWTSDEDKKLIAYIEKHGEGGWRTLPLKAGLQRCGKSCRLRWTNYLRPDIKRGDFSPEEEQKIIELHATIGNSWSAIAKQLSKRTDNEIKNYWNTYLKKRVAKTTETKRELAKSTKSSSSNDGQPNSANPNQTNNANNATKHSSQDAGNMAPHRTDMDSTQDRLPNVMPRSASAKLLNILATRLPSSYCPGIQKYGQMIQSPSALFDGKDIFSNSDDLSSSDSQSKPAGSSARTLLNKMAHCINKPTIYLETVNSVMPKSGNKGADTSFGDDLFGQTWMQAAMSNSTEAAEKLASALMAEDVPTQGVQEDQNGNGIEPLTEDLDLDFLRDWTIMDDDDDNGIGVIGGGLYEGGVSNTWINGDNGHII